MASVTVSPDTVTLVVQGTSQLRAYARTAEGQEVLDVVWSSSDPSIARVEARDLDTRWATVTGVASGAALIMATSQGWADTVRLGVVTVSFVAVSAGGDGDDGPLGPRGHTCGLTTSKVVFCWGRNEYRQLGDATFYAKSSPVGVVTGPSFAVVDAGSDATYGLSTDGGLYEFAGYGTQPLSWGVLTSVTVAGYRSVCALKVSGEARCSRDGWEPGNRRFRVLDGGFMDHACGITPDDEAFCWGSNFYGELGAGIAPGYYKQPVAVSGGLHFSSISAGAYHTCGLTVDQIAYCWGWGEDGELGDGAFSNSMVPRAVAGDVHFVALAAGYYHTCGLAVTGDAYCWGWGRYGELGTGEFNTESGVPLPVAGDLTFTALSAGNSHTCGLSTGGILYCWGTNEQGQLGDGTLTGRNLPVRVLGQR